VRPIFADPKNDYVFGHLFGCEDRRSILIAFLNAVLALDGPHRVSSVVLRPPPRGRPGVPGLRYGITRAECTDGRGATYAVEMEVLHIEEIHRRCIDEVAGTLSEPLSAFEACPESGDELGIVISEFELWPGKRARVPMLSRRRVHEQPSRKLVFLELPKYGAGNDPLSPVDTWAYLFREAQVLTSIPPALACSPFAEALEAARIARLTHDEWDAYISVAMDIEDKRAMLRRAHERGYRKGLLEGFEAYCKERGIDLSAEERSEMKKLGAKRLAAMIDRIKAERGRAPRQWS
jgi:predicted transposase/invertase (TIGR01784 family)